MMKIAVLRGDGIGPEVIDSALIVFDAITSKYGHQFELIDGKIGGIAIDEVGTPLPDDTISVCEEVGVDREIALKGILKNNPDPGALVIWKVEINKSINQ